MKKSLLVLSIFGAAFSASITHADDLWRPIVNPDSAKAIFEALEPVRAIAPWEGWAGSDYSTAVVSGLLECQRAISSPSIRDGRPVRTYAYRCLIGPSFQAGGAWLEGDFFVLRDPKQVTAIYDAMKNLEATCLGDFCTKAVKAYTLDGSPRFSCTQLTEQGVLHGASVSCFLSNDQEFRGKM